MCCRHTTVPQHHWRDSLRCPFHPRGPFGRNRKPVSPLPPPPLATTSVHWGICLCFALISAFVVVVLDFPIQLRSCGICLSLSDFLHFAQHPLGPTVWLQMARSPSFLGLSNVPLCTHHTLSIHSGHSGSCRCWCSDGGGTWGFFPTMQPRAGQLPGTHVPLSLWALVSGPPCAPNAPSHFLQVDSDAPPLVAFCTCGPVAGDSDGAAGAPVLRHVRAQGGAHLLGAGPLCRPGICSRDKDTMRVPGGPNPAQEAWPCVGSCWPGAHALPPCAPASPGAT